MFVYKILKNLSDYRFFIYFLIQHDFNINFLFSLSSIFIFIFYFIFSLLLKKQLTQLKLKSKIERKLKRKKQQREKIIKLVKRKERGIHHIKSVTQIRRFNISRSFERRFEEYIFVVLLAFYIIRYLSCLLYTSPSPRDS